MAGRQVFVSYSGKDGKWRAELEKQLKVLAHEGQLTLFRVEDIKPGADWRKEINDAMASARVAFFLVSANFLNSEFIRNVERPALLARHAKKEILVVPILLEPCPWKQVGWLEKLQLRPGDGTPLSTMKKKSDWQQALVDIVVEVAAYLDAAAVAAGSNPPQANQQPAPGSMAAGGEAPWTAFPGRPDRPPPSVLPTTRLRVQAHWRGEELDLVFAPPGARPLWTRPTSLGALDDQLRAAGLRGLGPVLDTLGGTDEQAAHGLLGGAALGRLGTALFDWMFGERSEHAPLFRALFDDPPALQTGPGRRPLRLQLRLDHAIPGDDHALLERAHTLAALPWRLLRHRDEWLWDVGWTVEHAAPDPEPSLELRAPCRMVALVPAAGPLAAAGERQITLLRELYARVFPGRPMKEMLRVARDPAELRAALEALDPQVLYALGRFVRLPGTRQNPPRDALALEAAAGPSPAGALPLDDLLAGLPAGLPAGRGPDLVWFDLLPASPGPPLRVPDALRARARCVVASGCATSAAETIDVTREVLFHLFDRGLDPVAAMHHHPMAGGAGFSLARAALRVHTRYERSSTQRLPRTSMLGNARRYLDRKDQRGRTQVHVTELAQSSTVRVLNLVAFASPGHQLDFLWSQLEQHLRAHAAHLVDLVWRRVAFPSDRHALPARLEDQLRTYLPARAGQRLAEAVKDQLPAVVPQGIRPVVVLDWGTLGRGGETGIKAQHLGEWIDFSSQILADACPAGARLVSFLALETTRHDELLRAIAAYQAQPGSQRVVLHHLPPLDDVHHGDLLTFFANPDHSSCPDHLRDGVILGILDETGGRFEETVTLIDDVELARRGWDDLAARGAAAGKTRTFDANMDL